MADYAVGGAGYGERTTHRVPGQREGGRVTMLLDNPTFASLAPEVQDKSATQVQESITARLKAPIDGETGDHQVWTSLAERLDALRECAIGQAQVALDWFRDLLTAARDLKVAEQAEEQAGRDGLDALPSLTDLHIGARTQIFQEYAPEDTPVLIGRIVEQVDVIAKPGSVRDVRLALRKTNNGLGNDTDLFERAYAYIEQYY